MLNEIFDNKRYSITNEYRFLYVTYNRFFNEESDPLNVVVI